MPLAVFTSSRAKRFVLAAPKLAVATVATLFAYGCVPPPPTADVPRQVESHAATASTSTTSSQAAAAPTTSQAAFTKTAKVLDDVFQDRELNTAEHGAWQILHGVLAYQREFVIRLGTSDERKSAVDYVLEGGAMMGWSFRPGDILDAETGRRGLKAIVEPGTKKGQGHADQWLAILAQCALPIDQPIQLDRQSYTLRDLLEQVQHDVPFNPLREYSWTLIGLTQYLPTDAEWTAGDGETWSITRLVAEEVSQDFDSSACGGTHRLIGIATALNRHVAAGGKVEGVWEQAQVAVDEAVARAFQYQNPDGSFSAKYFARPSYTSDMALVLGTTGHVLEFLAVAMSPEDLKSPQVTRAVDHLCDLLESTRSLPLECGALYHAAHGLVLYRDKLLSLKTTPGV